VVAGAYPVEIVHDVVTVFPLCEGLGKLFAARGLELKAFDISDCQRRSVVGWVVVYGKLPEFRSLCPASFASASRARFLASAVVMSVPCTCTTVRVQLQKCKPYLVHLFCYQCACIWWLLFVPVHVMFSSSQHGGDTLENIIKLVETVEAKQTKDFGTALQGFLAAAQAKVEGRFVGYPNQGAKLETQEGPKYIRVVSKDIWNGQVAPSGSAYCFVEKTTGNVFKAARYKVPAKGVRSNIFAEDFGASGVTGYGAIYR
jgi:hypothetical protein